MCEGGDDTPSPTEFFVVASEMSAQAIYWLKNKCT